MTSQSVAVPTLGSRRTISDVVFHNLCFFHGLCVGHKTHGGLALAVAAFWILFAPMPITLLLSYVYDILTQPGRSIPSFSELTCHVCGFTHAAASMYAVSTFHSQRKEIQPLLRGNGRGFMSVFFPFAYQIPWLTMIVFNIFERSALRSRISYASFFFVETAMATFLVVYTDLIESLAECSARFRDACRGKTQPIGVLVAEKWQLREKIRTINGFSSLQLMAHYVRAVVLVLYLLSKRLTGAHNCVETAGLGAITIAYFTTLAHFAGKASQLETQCRAAELDILRQTFSQERGGRDDNKVFRFHESFDTLRVGVFVHSSKNFIRLLLFGISFIASVLQFDHAAASRVSALAAGE